MHSLETVELAFDEFGNPGNPPIVILHGFFASSRNWRQIARQLGEKYHVLVPDLRNHGASPHTALMDYPHMAADIYDFLDHRGFNDATVIGHSMGGKAAMWFALHYPERVDDLIIVDIAPVSYRHSFDQLIDAMIGLPLEDLSNRKQAEDYLSDAIPELSFRQFLLQNLVLQGNEYAWKIDLDIFKKTAPNIISFPEIKPPGKITKKVLFVTGSESRYILPDYSDDVYSLFPAAVMEKIPEAGHWVHAQAPQAFLRVVNEFLS